MLRPLVRGDNIDDKCSDCSHANYLEILLLLTNFCGVIIAEGGGEGSTPLLSEEE